MYNTRPKPGTQRKELHHQHLGSAFGVSSPPPVLQPSAAPPCLWHPTLAAAPRSAGGSGLCSVVAMGTSAPSWVWGAGCLGGGRGGVDGSPTSCSIRCRSSWICCSRASQSCCTSWLCSATRLGGGEGWEGQTVPRGCGSGDPALPTRPTDSPEVPSPSRDLSGTLAMGCVTAQGAQPQTRAQCESSARAVVEAGAPPRQGLTC